MTNPVERFYLQREQDASGVSGIGTVADGVHFLESGYVVLAWRITAAGVPGLGIYRSIADVEKIHGHNGMTKLVFY